MQGNTMMQVPSLHGDGNQEAPEKQVDQVVAIGTGNVTAT